MSDSDNTSPIEVITEDAPFRAHHRRPTKPVRQVVARKDRHSVKRVLHGICTILDPLDIDVTAHRVQGHFSTNRHTATAEA